MFFHVLLCSTRFLTAMQKSWILGWSISHANRSVEPNFWICVNRKKSVMYCKTKIVFDTAHVEHDDHPHRILEGSRAHHPSIPFEEPHSAAPVAFHLTRWHWRNSLDADDHDDQGVSPQTSIKGAGNWLNTEEQPFSPLVAVIFLWLCATLWHWTSWVN